MAQMNPPIKVCFVTTVSITLKCFVLEFAKYAHLNYDWDITFVCDEDAEFAEMLPSFINYVPVSMKRGANADVFRVVRQLTRLFDQEKFDIVQYSTPNASLYAALASRIVGVPVRLYCQWGMAYVGFSGIKRSFFKAIEKLVCSCSTWIEPDSMSNLEFAHTEKLYPATTGSVVWNGSACGVDLSKFDIEKRERYRREGREKLGIPPESFVIGFVGRITRDKGINELFQAVSNLMSQKRDLYLLLVGNPETDKNIDSSLYQWAQQNERVLFSGYTDCVEYYLSVMDCYVLPSYREGFGMGVVEAEAMGLPVVVTDIPGPVDAMVEKETGLVAKKQDVPSLEMAITTLINDKELRSRLASAAVDFAIKNFDQKVLFKKIVDDRYALLRGR